MRRIPTQTKVSSKVSYKLWPDPRVSVYRVLGIIIPVIL